MQWESRWDEACRAVTRTEGACDGLGSQSVRPQPPHPLEPCVHLPSHTHLPLRVLPRYHCTPRTRETMTRRVPRTRQNVMGRFPVLRADGGARGGPVETVRGGVCLVWLCAWGIVTLGLDHLSLSGRGKAPRGEMGLVLLPQR